MAESQWGPEWAQDRLALRLSRHVASMRAARSRLDSREISAAVGDQVLSSAVVSLVASHVVERGYLVSESISHRNAIDRLGSLMIEFNPLASPKGLRCIERLMPVVDTCLFLEPLPEEAWDLLASLIRARVLRSNETRRTAVRLINGAKNSDVVLTARAEYEHIYGYLTSVRGTEVANRECLDLLRAHGREVLPEVLDLLGVPREAILDRSAQLSWRDVARAINGSSRVCLPSGPGRSTYVDTWASVLSATIREPPH